MKKTVYVVCVCVLFVLLFYEVKRNYETENDGTIIVPTGSFVSKVQKENHSMMVPVEIRKKSLKY